MTTQPPTRYKKGILIYGASGHAKVVIDIVEKHGLFAVQALADDNPVLKKTTIYGYEVMGGKEELLGGKDLLTEIASIVAIGNNRIRTDIATWIHAHGGRLCEAVIHPSAQLARGIFLGDGSVVMAGTVINSDSILGKNSIVNTGAIIDHDCVIGDEVHLAPGVTLCGGVRIGNTTLVGAGAIILPNLQIGKNVTIGAGATVRDNVPDNVTVVGTPARPLA